jgi:hypothetical protein
MFIDVVIAAKVVSVRAVAIMIKVIMVAVMERLVFGVFYPQLIRACIKSY